MTDPASRAALAVERGSPHPLGASCVRGGVNFSLFSINATGVELLLLEEGASAVAGRLSEQLVDTLTNELDNLGVDQNSLNDPGTNALFQIDRAMNPFNLRKGNYEYTKGITEALTNALNLFFPSNQ
jgi:pullulanase/glycogen debranching enzyme